MFSFAKTSGSSEATFGAQEKGAKLSTTVTRVDTKARFDIPKKDNKEGRGL
jgi:hypothetical protein